MEDKIIKYGFRQNTFGKQILQVLVQVEHPYEDYSCFTKKWRDATRDEANEIYCKLNKE